MARVQQQVNGLPLVGDGGVAKRRVVTDVGLGDSAGQSVEAEIRPSFTYWEGVQALIPYQGHMTQLAKVLYNGNEHMLKDKAINPTKNP